IQFLDASSHRDREPSRFAFVIEGGASCGVDLKTKRETKNIMRLTRSSQRTTALENEIISRGLNSSPSITNTNPQTYSRRRTVCTATTIAPAKTTSSSSGRFAPAGSKITAASNAADVKALVTVMNIKQPFPWPAAAVVQSPGQRTA